MSRKAKEIVEFVHANSLRIGDKSVPTGPLIGCVLAKTVRVRRGDGRFGSAKSVGWSQVNRTMGDSFDKKEALRVARQRANDVLYDTAPKKVLKVMDRMYLRADRYFKGVDWA